MFQNHWKNFQNMFQKFKKIPKLSNMFHNHLKNKNYKKNLKLFQKVPKYFLKQSEIVSKMFQNRRKYSLFIFLNRRDCSRQFPKKIFKNFPSKSKKMNPKIVPKSSAQVPRNSKKPSKYVPGHSRPLQQSSKSDPTLWPPTDSLPPMKCPK